MSNGPLPSYLSLVSDLPRWKFGTKVRFLGTVQSYTTETATLTLYHAFPRRHHLIRADVDIGAALPTLGHEQTRVGEWVNVIGYVQGVRDTFDFDRAAGITDHRVRRVRVKVQAVMVWSAGAMDLGAYEATIAEEIKARKECWRKEKESKRRRERRREMLCKGKESGDVDGDECDEGDEGDQGEGSDEYEFPYLSDASGDMLICPD